MTDTEIDLSPETRIKTSFPAMKWVVMATFAVAAWATQITLSLSRVVSELSGLRQDVQEISAVDKRLVRAEFEIATLKAEMDRMRK